MGSCGRDDCYSETEHIDLASFAADWDDSDGFKRHDQHRSVQHELKPTDWNDSWRHLSHALFIDVCEHSHGGPVAETVLP